MNSDDYNSNKISSEERSQSLSMLLEAAGGPAGSTDRMNESIQRSLTGGETVSRATVESATRSRPTNNNDEAPHGSSVNLSVLASVAQDSNGNAAASTAPAQPLVEARVATGSSFSAAPSTSASHESAEKQRAALLATVKSLSNDPLVQLSMMRAMQQQQVSPDVVIKNKEKQAALALKANARKRKPATGGPAQLPMKSQRVSLSQGTAPTSRPASAVRQAAPQAGLVQAQQPQIADMSGLLAGLLSEQTQPNVFSNQVPQINRNAQSGSMQGQDSNPPRGGIPSIQSLLGALQQHPQQQQLGLIPALFNVPLSTQDNDGGISSLIQNLISNLTPQQQLDLAQSLIPQSMGPAVRTQQQAQPKTRAAARPGVESSLSSCQKDSDTSSGRSQSSQLIRIPCRARGMPLDHNFQTAHFVLPKDIQHGQNLVCSYPACRDGGVKFRYCLCCRIPVAKRNFRLRHSHDEMFTQAPNEGAMKIPSTICVSGSRESSQPQKSETPYYHQQHQYPQTPGDSRAKTTAVETKKNKKREHNDTHVKHSKRRRRQYEEDEEGHVYGDDAAIADIPTAKKSKKSKRKKDKKKKKDKKRRKSGQSHGTPSTNEARAHLDTLESAHVVQDLPRTSASSKAKIDLQTVPDSRLYMWANLLGQRPRKDDEDNMSKWLMSVLAVSDLKKPLKADKEEIYSSPSSLSSEGFESSEPNQSAAAASGGETSSD